MPVSDGKISGYGETDGKKWGPYSIFLMGAEKPPISAPHAEMDGFSAHILLLSCSRIRFLIWLKVTGDILRNAAMCLSGI